MPTGERRARSRGFTYLLLLFGLALGAAALGVAAPSWQAAMQREREAELLFRGAEFARALAAYRDASAAGAAATPQRLEDLIEDARASPARHHLRRVYVDPFTAQADWALVREDAGGIVAVHSTARLPTLRRIGVPLEGDIAGREPQVRDWVFRAAAPASSPSVTVPGSAGPRPPRPAAR